MTSAYLKPTQIYRLSDYIANSHLTNETFAAIKRDFDTRGLVSSVLISVEDNSVVELPNEMIVLREANFEVDVHVWNYADWRDAEASCQTNDYDVTRFYRSTEIGTLRRKVLEHSLYSFITREQKGASDIVVQYTFVRISPDADIILGIRQDITQCIEHDIITGGLNREGLLREISHRLADTSRGIHYSLLCFNIRNFRVINELHGNAIGDKVLQYMYTSLVYSGLHPISYARYESDTFICLIDREHLDVDAITRLCQQECTIGTMKISFRCLCGIYHIIDEKVTAVNACSHARFAITFIKDQNIIPWIEYTPQMQQRLTTETSQHTHSDKSRLEEQNAQLLKLVEEGKCLRMLLDAQDIHYFEWDINTHDDISGDKFVKMYGLPSNVIPNMPEVAPLVVPEDLDRFRAFYVRAAQGEKMGTDCFRLYTPDGKGYTWYRKTFYTLFDTKGKPYKAIITMQDCQNEYRYRMLRTRDRMLTLQQEIVTFIYTLNNDSLSITYCAPNGEVNTAIKPQFLSTPNEQLLPDQATIANNIRLIIENNLRTGYFDFTMPIRHGEYRAHYAMVDGEYGHLYAIIGQAEDINKTRDRLNAKEQMLRLAEIDGLTQIYNRTTGERKMNEALSQRRPGVFGILDCDKFKHVNDTFGHATGDALLQGIARIISQGNPHGINMRLGGDEFSFFVEGDYTTEGVRSDLSHLFADIEALHIPGMEGYPVAVSVGAIIYDGKQPTDFDSIYRAADLLLYESKKYEGSRLTI